MRRPRTWLFAVVAAVIMALLLSAGALPAGKPSVTLVTQESTVTVGGSVSLSGMVTNPKVGATSIAILERAGTTWKRVATTKLTVKNTFAVKVTPDAAGEWSLVANYRAGKTKARSEPIVIDVQAGTGAWAAGASGAWGCAAVGTDGTLWAWGRNTDGQLGLGATDDIPHPTPAQVATDTAWAAVSAGSADTLALKTDGTLWAWGENGEGRLGVGETSATVSAPARVGDDTDWAAVSGGNDCTLALKKDGSLWAWGANGNGQLGLGDGKQRTSPTQVGGDTDWAAVSCGHDHAMGIRTDGSLWAWGYNGNGQLGLGDTKLRVKPTMVGDESDWAAVSCGNDSTLAIKASGRLLAWGYNGNGQLGLGDIVQRTTPTTVGLYGEWAAVSCGDVHTLALKKDGTLWSFGWNGNGQLGVGDDEDRMAPAQVGTDTDWTAACGGKYFSLALKRDGSLWSWGYNADGQLGVGDTDQREAPTEVVAATP